MTDAPESLLSLPPGTRGAGRIRYGAAMALYQSGALSPAELEAWRIASASDTLPAKAALGHHDLPEKARPEANTAAILARLMEEAAAYLAPLRCPGAGELRRLIARRTAADTPPAPQITPTVTDHLPAALTALSTTHPALAAAIHTASPHLCWASHNAYPADQIGPSFPANHAAASLIGPTAPFHALDGEFGVFLIAPHILYRDHSHATPELFLPLTGPHGWRFGPNRPLILKPAHNPVWNDSHRPHLTKVGPTPFLALYGRTQAVDIPAVVLPADDWPRLEALRLKAAP